MPYTPAWAEKVTGVKRNDIALDAREFADNAAKTNGKSMVILGAGINHWYHMDMIYRGIISMLTMCGCVGQSGGGWAHYVGQEKLRPQPGWTALAFALDWGRPPRQMNSTSFWYAHTDQWRYEKLNVVGDHLADGRSRRLGLQPHRLQCPRRAHGLAALRAAARNQSAEDRRRGGEGGQARAAIRRREPEVGRAQNVVRRPGRAEELSAQSVRLALEPVGLVAARATNIS